MKIQVIFETDTTEPCGPFQIIVRPHIDKTGAFQMHKNPGSCGPLSQEQPKAGAPQADREKRLEKKDQVRKWLKENPHLKSTDIAEKFKKQGLDVAPATVRKYKKELMAERLDKNPVGRSLARKRRSVGLTQHQVSHAAGIPINKLVYVETGRASLEPNEMERVRKVLERQARSNLGML